MPPKEFLRATRFLAGGAEKPVRLDRPGSLVVKAGDHERTGRYGGQMLFTAAQRRSRESWAMAGSAACCCEQGSWDGGAVLLLRYGSHGTLSRDAPPWPRPQGTRAKSWLWSDMVTLGAPWGVAARGRGPKARPRQGKGRRGPCRRRPRSGRGRGRSARHSHQDPVWPVHRPGGLSGGSHRKNSCPPSRLPAGRVGSRKGGVGRRPRCSDQAARRAALAGNERDGKARMGGSSCGWSKAAGFAVLFAALRRRQP